MYPIRSIFCGLTLLCLCLCFQPGLDAFDSGLSPADGMLEKVRFRLFGNEKEGVAEIRLEGDEYHLRLFNEKLASYYSVKISSADLISTQPLGSVVSEQITQQRSELVREREIIRAERREKARAEKTDPERGVPNSRSSSGVGSSSATGGVIHEEVSRELGKQGYLNLLEDFGNRVEGMQGRIQGVLDSGEGFVSHLKSWGQESDSKPRVFHALKSESHSIVEAAESLKKSLKSRLKEIVRVREQTGQGHLKVRDLPEVIDRIRQRILRCEERLGELESLEMACADGLDSLGNPVLLLKETTELAGVDSTAKSSVPASGADTRTLEKQVSIIPASFKGQTVDPTTPPGKKPQLLKPADQQSTVSTESGKRITVRPAGDTDRPEPESPEPESPEPESPVEEHPVSGAGGGAREIILGAIFGAILVLGLGRLIKALP